MSGAGRSVGCRGLDWRWCRFDALGVHELQHIYAARQQVFALEQQCVYLDVDGCDERGLSSRGVVDAAARAARLRARARSRA